jgi:hypothetical protein
MKKGLKKWWGGFDRGYALSEEPSPKEAFYVLLFFIIPIYGMFFIIIKTITNE